MANRAKQARAFVKQKIAWLTRGGNEAATRAALAKLRRGIGKAPGSQPDLWDITLSALPETLLSTGNEASQGEWAVHAALTLFALHQQGKNIKEQCMNREGESLGTSCRKLIDGDKTNEDAVLRRFQAAAVSENFTRFIWQLRGLIQLLKAKNIPLDYPMLTEDLYWFQLSGRRDSVRLRWGQDFYRLAKGDNTKNKEEGVAN